jgi:hypothetical protein
MAGETQRTNHPKKLFSIAVMFIMRRNLPRLQFLGLPQSLKIVSGWFLEKLARSCVFSKWLPFWL